MRVFAASCFLLLVACPPFPEVGAYRCASDAGCTSGQLCLEELCRACTPLRCEELDRCGSFDDGCGGTIECPCLCTPATCTSLSPACGELDDGCGGALFCPCAPSCVPSSCPRECAYVPDGCGGLAECGRCAAPLSCGVIEDGFCGRPLECVANAIPCGLFTTSASIAIDCGPCPVERPLCFGARRRISTPEIQHPGGSSFAENGRWFFYFTSEHQRRTNDACARHYRARIDRSPEPDWSTIELVPSSDFSFLDNAPVRLCNRLDDVDCNGWASAPKLRRDGLEMVFAGNYPCGDWDDPELWLSFRSSTREPWQPPVLLHRLTTLTSTIDDGVHHPALLGDDRTLLYAMIWGELRAARRSTATPGDRSFVPIPIEYEDAADLPPDTSRVQILPMSLSCDGAHLLYGRTLTVPTGELFDLRIVPILSTEPLSFGTARAVLSSPPGGLRIESANETPDCSGLYVRTLGGLYYYPRESCD